MKPVSLGLLIACAAWVLLPQAAAAQCEGGTSTAGYYLRNSSYVPGGCAYTNSTTPGQMYPSGAQPLPSTNPVAGASALPGQRVATGQLPVTAGDLGQPLGAVGTPPQTLGPGAPIGLTSNPHPTTTGTGVVSGIGGATNLVVPGVQPGAGAVLREGALRDTAYGYSLPAAPPVSSQAASPAAADPSQPPPPGRGGPTFIGEDGEDSTSIALPNQQVGRR